MLAREGAQVLLADINVPLADARRIYVARTYAYVAAKQEGLVIVDIKKPLAPKLYQRFTAGGTAPKGKPTTATTFTWPRRGSRSRAAATQR